MPQGCARFEKGLESIQKEIDKTQLKIWIQSLGLVRTQNHGFGVICLLMVFETIGVDFYPRKINDQHFGMVLLKRSYLN